MRETNEFRRTGFFPWFLASLSAQLSQTCPQVSRALHHLMVTSWLTVSFRKTANQQHLPWRNQDCVGDSSRKYSSGIGPRTSCWKSRFSKSLWSCKSTAALEGTLSALSNHSPAASSEPLGRDLKFPSRIWHFSLPLCLGTAEGVAFC